MPSSRPRPLPLLVAALLVAAPARAGAARCPNVMLVLDRSGSMADPPDANGMTSKWELLQDAVHKVVGQYGDRVPFGLQMFTFSALGFPDDNTCYAQTRIDVEPAHGTAARILQLIDAAMPDGGTNTGEAIRRANADAALRDSTRKNYIILITDGDPNCNSKDQCLSCNAGYTISQIAAAAANNIHTFVVGFDGQSGVSPANLNAMAKAGLEPQNMGNCGSRQQPCYYSASNAQAFNLAIDQIVNQVVSGGEFGGMAMCDDSCIANGCPEGQQCVTTDNNPEPTCQPDPCAAGLVCEVGAFCRGGACVPACLSACPAGKSCANGQCTDDPCKGTTCEAGLLCSPVSGQCVPDPCKAGCRAGQLCDVLQGRCVDDPCRLVKCPDGTRCVRGGNCEAPPSNVIPGGGGAVRHGCDLGPGGGANGGRDLALLVGLLSLLLPLSLRRRR